MSFDTFDDGYTLEFSYTDPIGRVNKNKGTFRALSYLSREMIQHEISKSKDDPKKSAEIICRTVASQVKSWSLTKDGKPLPITVGNVLNYVHPAHVDQMYMIVIGMVPALPVDERPTAPASNADPLAAILGDNVTAEGLQKN